MNVVSVVAVVVNALVCVVVCLIVWFQYAAKATPVGARDSTAYAIIGTFQLWMILVADAACLVTEVRCLRYAVRNCTVSHLKKIKNGLINWL